MRMNRYRFDPMALIAGLVFTGVAVAYLLRAAGTLSVTAEWSLATAAIGVGVAGLAGALWAMLPTPAPAAPVASYPAREGRSDPYGEGPQEYHAAPERPDGANPAAGDDEPDAGPPTVDLTK